MIHKITNHSTLAWRIANRTSKPIVHTINIADRTLNLWGDDLVYRWYRPPGMGSYTVSCALLALEQWLNKSIENGASIRPMLENILKKTNCVAVVGIASSILLQNSDKLDMVTAVSILENPIFWLMENRRYVYEIIESEFVTNMAYYNDKIMHDIMMSINSQYDRKLKFNQIIPLILLSDNVKLKIKLKDKIKNFVNMEPKYFKHIPQSLRMFHLDSDPVEVKRMCEIWSHQADMSNYDIIKKDGKSAYVFDPRKYLSSEDLSDFRQCEQRTTLFAYTIKLSDILQNKIPHSQLSINDAMEYADSIKDNKINPVDKLNFMSSLSAVMITKKWDEIDDSQKILFTSEIINAANMINDANVISDVNPIEINYMQWDRSVAYALPYLTNTLKKIII